MVGDSAPALNVSKWVKGEPVTAFAKGQVYVVEFWATWCGPCKVSIPHLTKLQEELGSKVKVIGVSVWETKQSDVEPFVKEMGDKMDYTIAMDQLPSPTANGNEGQMAKGWMMAAGQNGIPSAFIINGDGKVAWIGHPMEMDKPLESVVAGTWDIAKAQETQRKEMEKQATMMRVGKRFSDAMRAKNYDEAIAACDEMSANGLADQGGMNKFLVLVKFKKDRAAATAMGNKLIDEIVKDDANSLNMLAWTLVDPAGKIENPDLDLALRAAQRSVEIDRNWAGLDTLARVHFRRGDKAKAIELQKEAISMAPDEASKKELQSALDEYTKG